MRAEFLILSHNVNSSQHTNCAVCVQSLQVKDGDRIRIDAKSRRMDALDVDKEEWQRRREQWQPPPLKATEGTLYKYIKNVTSASLGCVTDA